MQNQEEIWKDVSNYEGIYQVSNLGNVKSLEILVRLNYRPRIKKETILKNNVDFWGYCVVSLCKNLKLKTTKVHRLVAEVFIPNPENKPQVNHINGIKTDNRVENLEWVTNKENSIHAVKNNLIKKAKGENNSKSKLKEFQVLEIKKLSKTKSQREIAKMYNVTHQSIYAILSNKSWKHLT